MSLPYRTKRRLQNLAIAGLILILVLAALWLVWMLWLERFVVYTRDGVKLDFSLSSQTLSGVPAEPPLPGETIPIYINDGEEPGQTERELEKLSGYYIDGDMLRKEMATVVSQIRLLPPGTPVMMDIKDISGRFYYSTAVGAENNANMDIGAVDDLIDLMRQRNLYMIARMPAFRDRVYGGSHVPDGIYHSSRGYLWVDGTRCYWLNPTREGVISYLLEITSELKALGFDEAVFTDFRVPDSENIYFPWDKTQALNDAAALLARAAATESFAVSFQPGVDITLPGGRTRLYVDGADPATAEELAAGLETPDARLVILTESRDTRLEEYGILRPLNTAIITQEEEE